MSNTKYNVATGGTPLNLWLPNQIKACLNKMNEVLLLINHHNMEGVNKEDLEIFNFLETNQQIKEDSLKKELQDIS